MGKQRFYVFIILAYLFFLKLYAYDKNDVVSLINHSYKFYDNGLPDSALVYSNLAMHKADSSGTPVYLLKVLINQGIIHRKLRSYVIAKQRYLRAASIAKNENDYRRLSIVYNNLGIIYMDVSQVDSALYYYFKSAELEEDKGATSRMVSVYNNISKAFRRNLQYKEALEYAEKALKVVESNNEISPYSEALTYLQLGNAYYEMDSLGLAGKYYNHSLQICQKIGHRDMLSTCQLNLGNISFKNNEYMKALDFYLKCLPVIQQVGKTEQVVRVLNNTGNAWYEMEKLDSALFYYRRAEQLARKHHFSQQLGAILEGLSSVYWEKGDKDSAFVFMKERMEVAQNFYKEETADAIAELQARYETEKKEKEIIAQRGRIQQAVIQRKNLLFALITVIFIAVSGILFFVSRSRTLKLQNERNTEKHNKEVTRLLQEQELKSLDAMIEGQDTERKRIAEDLHVRLGTTLAATKMHLEAAEEQLQSKQYEYIDNLINTAIEDTRQISHNMLSGVLTKFGLIAALKDLKKTIETAGDLSVSIKTIQFDQRLATDKEINLYRIIQELISNTLKHAQATQLSILLEKREGLLYLFVSDNGIGFDNNKSYKGIGLRNIQTRVSKIGGTLWVESKLGMGTRTEIKVPV